MLACRTGELTPLIQMWLDANPYSKVTALLKRSLRLNPDIRRLAGKRLRHLVSERAGW